MIDIGSFVCELPSASRILSIKRGLLVETRALIGISFTDSIIRRELKKDMSR
jgi:hypothetical protein